MAYCVAVFVLWSTVVALVPFFEGMLADWSYILAIITFAVYSTFCNFAPGLGTMHSYNNVERVLSYVSAKHRRSPDPCSSSLAKSGLTHFHSSVILQRGVAVRLSLCSQAHPKQ